MLDSRRFRLVITFVGQGALACAALAALATAPQAWADDRNVKGDVKPSINSVLGGSSGGDGRGGIAGSQQCAAQCASDIIADGFTNVDDLLAVINHWGHCVTCPPTFCTGDVNHDCWVNVDDLLAIINGWGPCPAPANNNCANTAYISLGSTYTFCTQYATTDGPAEPGCNFGFGDPQIHNDIWYTFGTNQFGGNYWAHIDTCGSDFDTKIAVYRFNGLNGCTCDLANAQLVICNDDTGLSSCSLQSRVEFQLVANSCYRVRIGGYQGASGTGVLHTKGFYIGDDCLNAVDLGTVFSGSPLSVAVVTTSTSGSQYTPGYVIPQAPCTTLPDGNDVWYKFKIGCGGTLIGSAYTCDPYTDYDTILTIYRGTCDGLTLVGCSDDYTGNPACQLNGLYRKSLVDLGSSASPGYYYARVSGYNNAWGSFKLIIGISCIN